MNELVDNIQEVLQNKDTPAGIDADDKVAIKDTSLQGDLSRQEVDTSLPKDFESLKPCDTSLPKELRIPPEVMSQERLSLEEIDTSLPQNVELQERWHTQFPKVDGAQGTYDTSPSRDVHPIVDYERCAFQTKSDTDEFRIDPESDEGKYTKTQVWTLKTRWKRNSEDKKSRCIDLILILILLGRMDELI